MDQYMINTWEHRYRSIKDTVVKVQTPKQKDEVKEGESGEKYTDKGQVVEYKAGLIPMKMDSCAALDLLKEKGIVPTVIYVDANHHYETVIRDVEHCIQCFPEAHLIGDDWDYEEVRRAVRFVAAKYGRTVYVHQAKCWTFSGDVVEPILEGAKQKKRAEEAASRRAREQTKTMAKSSFADMMKAYKK